MESGTKQEPTVRRVFTERMFNPTRGEIDAEIGHAIARVRDKCPGEIEIADMQMAGTGGYLYILLTLYIYPNRETPTITITVENFEEFKRLLDLNGEVFSTAHMAVRKAQP